jgi:mRNA interferase RelE/StbE
MPAKTVLLSPRAQKDYAKLEQNIQDRIRQSLKELGAGSKRLDIKKLKGTGDREDLYRLKVGDYRIIYSPEPDIIQVIRIDHRGKGYSWLD